MRGWESATQPLASVLSLKTLDPGIVIGFLTYDKLLHKMNIDMQNYQKTILGEKWNWNFVRVGSRAHRFLSWYQWYLQSLSSSDIYLVCSCHKF